MAVSSLVAIVWAVTALSEDSILRYPRGSSANFVQSQRICQTTRIDVILEGPVGYSASVPGPRDTSTRHRGKIADRGVPRQVTHSALNN